LAQIKPKTAKEIIMGLLRVALVRAMSTSNQQARLAQNA